MSKLSLTENQSKISALTSYLATLASTAENHFWNGITNDFNLFGATGNTDPLTVATDMCAASEQVCNQILIHLADMTGETATEVNWTASVLTQWTTPVSLAIQRISQIVSDITAITTSAPDGFLGQTDYDIRGTLQATFDTLYDQAEDVLNTGLGPYFPTVFTAYWPKLTTVDPIDAYPVKIKCTEDDDVLRLTLYDADDNALLWTGNQAGFDVLTAGDLVYIDSLSVTGYTGYAGSVYEIDAVDDTDPAHIDLIVPGIVATSPLTEETSDPATTIASVFKIRKVKDAPAP
jgi:hypothetical protein